MYDAIKTVNDATYRFSSKVLFLHPFEIAQDCIFTEEFIRVTRECQEC